MNKYLALQKDVFDISKVTVVGSPNITSDGVASGFSASDYITLGQGLLTNANTWELEFDYDATDVPDNTVGTIFQNVQTSPTYSGLVIQGRNYIITLFGGSGTGTTWDVMNAITVPIQYKSFNKIKIGYNGTKYYCFVNGVEKWSLVSDVKIAFPNNNCVIGYHSWWASLQYGSIDLKQFKIYVDNQLVFQPVKPTYLLERRKPKVWNKGQFTIVGNPSITDEGVASGFSGNNYIEAPKIDITKPFTINIKIKTSSTLSAASNEYFLCGDDNRTFIIGIDYGKLHAWISSNNSWWDIGNVSGGVLLNPNTEYFIRFSWDGNIYKIDYSTDNVDFVNGITINSSTPIYPINRIFLGSWATNGNELTGSINLKSIKYYTDNNLVFDGGGDTYVYDPSKFSVVGTPTITEYGIARGFSTTSYIHPNKIINLTKSWEVELELTTPSDLTTQNVVFTAGDGETHDTRFCYSFFTVNGGFGFNTTYNGTSWGVTSQRNTAINPNSKYCVRFGWDEQSYYIMTSLDGDEFNDYVRVDSTEACYRASNKDTFGNWVGHNQHYPFTGSINLASVITRNSDKELFCGVVEKFYMLRR
ncbi:MAG: hypothetical protein II304_03140 [Bacteroidales bacterium]|nr:hypothetical protein [Bacteroidales bacterium]